MGAGQGASSSASSTRSWHEGRQQMPSDLSHSEIRHRLDAVLASQNAFVSSCLAAFSESQRERGGPGLDLHDFFSFLSLVCEHYNIPPPPDDTTVTEVFQHYDFNGDGLLDFGEFQNAYLTILTQARSIYYPDERPTTPMSDRMYLQRQHTIAPSTPPAGTRTPTSPMVARGGSRGAHAGAPIVGGARLAPIPPTNGPRAQNAQSDDSFVDRSAPQQFPLRRTDSSHKVVERTLPLADNSSDAGSTAVLWRCWKYHRHSELRRILSPYSGHAFCRWPNVNALSEYFRKFDTRCTGYLSQRDFEHCLMKVACPSELTAAIVEVLQEPGGTTVTYGDLVACFAEMQNQYLEASRKEQRWFRKPSDASTRASQSQEFPALDAN